MTSILEQDFWEDIPLMTQEMFNKHLQAYVKQEKDKSYKEGLLQGIWLYSWWKEGVQYVGTSGKTYKQAVAEIEGKEVG